MTITALLLSCEACGMTAWIDRDDPESFCAFVNSHLIPVIDEFETAEQGA